MSNYCILTLLSTCFHTTILLQLIELWKRQSIPLICKRLIRKRNIIVFDFFCLFKLSDILFLLFIPCLVYSCIKNQTVKRRVTGPQGVVFISSGAQGGSFINTRAVNFETRCQKTNFQCLFPWMCLIYSTLCILT